jgi:hypothetical protein
VSSDITMRRRHPVFSMLLGGLCLGLIVTGWFGYRAHDEMLAARRSLAVKQQEWQAMGRISIPANQDIASQRLAAEQALERLKNQLRFDSPAAIRLRTATPPVERTDAFFDLALMVDQLRERAARHGVTLQPDERFGFAAYANGGPVVTQIPVVHRQRLLAQYLVEHLLAVQPMGLHAVQRERPGGAMPDRSDASATMADYFTLDPRLSVRASGGVESQALRVIFTGTTPTLRKFINRLADSELPLLVRAVEVEPQVNPGDGAQSLPVVEATERPFIRPTPSKFTVTVEFIEKLTAGGVSP